MNRGILKELRGLFPAWCVAAVLAVLLPFRGLIFGRLFWDAPTQSFMTGPALLALSLCIAAAVVYSSEFQFGTLQMLLAQPTERAKIWREKLAACAMAVVPLLVLYVGLSWAAAAIGKSPRFQGRVWSAPEQPWLWLFFATTTLLSMGYWALLARNLIGAVVLNVGSQMLWLLAVNSGWQALRARTSFLKELEAAEFAHLVLAGVLYAAVFAWLGWRKFRMLELVDSVHGDGAAASSASGAFLGEVSAAAVGTRSWRRHLLAKEFRLQRPTFLLAAAFAGFWIVGAVLVYFLDKDVLNRENFLIATAFLYFPLSLILAGCISTGEEARMGMFEWHLTYPVSVWKLWLAKAVVGFFCGVALAVCLPAALMLAAKGTGLAFGGAIEHLEVWPLAVVTCLVFLVSFWAATYMRNTIGATLVAVSVAVLGVLVFAFASWLTPPDAGLQTPLLVWVVSEFQLSTALIYSDIAWFVAVLWTFTMPALLLWQSYRGFRRNLNGVVAMIRSAAVLLLAVLVLSFWTQDLMRCLMRFHNSVLMTDLQKAVESLPSTPFVNGRRDLTVQDLEKTGTLSKRTRRWIRGSKIWLQEPGYHGRATGTYVGITFPSGKGESVYIRLPEKRQSVGKSEGRTYSR